MKNNSQIWKDVVECGYTTDGKFAENTPADGELIGCARVKLKYLLIPIILTMVIGCSNNTVAQERDNLSSELEKVKVELASLKTENKKLSEELEEIKTGPDRLLAEAKAHYDSKNLDGLNKTLVLLKEKHPSAVEVTSVSGLLTDLTTLLDQEKAEAEKKAAADAAEKEKRLKQATSLMRKTTDEVTGTTYYTDKTTTEYVDKNSFHALISQNKENVPTLFFRIQYAGDDWVFIDRYTFKIDDDSFEIKAPLGEVKRDNGYGGVWEYYTAYVTKENLDLIKKIISSEKTIIRHQGDQFMHDRTVTDKEKKALQNVLDAYEALGGAEPLF